jgi:copper chaperone NosL
MKNVLLLAISIIVIACSIKPEPLQFGMDACYTCKMTLMDNKYGAELVTRKGKVYKFDDINCMLNFYHSGSEATEDFNTYWSLILLILKSLLMPSMRCI